MFDVDIQRFDRASFAGKGVPGNRSLFLNRGGIYVRKSIGRAFGFDVFIRKASRLFRVNDRGCAGNASKAKGYFATPTRGSRVASGIKLIARFVCREPRFYNRIQRILCYRCHETDVLHLPCTTNDKSLYLVLYYFDDALADTLDRIST